MSNTQDETRQPLFLKKRSNKYAIGKMDWPSRVDSAAVVHVSRRLSMLDTFCHLLIGDDAMSAGQARRLKLCDYYDSLDFEEWQVQAPTSSVADDMMFTIEQA